MKGPPSAAVGMFAALLAASCTFTKAKVEQGLPVGRQVQALPPQNANAEPTAHAMTDQDWLAKARERERKTAESVSSLPQNERPAIAKTASELFDSVSASVVVVYVEDEKGQPKSFGSGVVIAQGEVVTNCHVIKKAAALKVKHRNDTYPATLKYADYERDVCSLAVPSIRAPATVLGDTKAIKVGQKIFAIGAPLGLELTLSEGIVSGLRSLGDGHYFLQISTPISVGSSGGGLFDEEGRLIGLTTFYLSGGQQLNFAVPVEWVKELPQRSAEARLTGLALIGWLVKAIELEQKQDWSGLLKHAYAWTQAQPQQALAWYSLGVAYDDSGQFAQAIEAYRQALRLNPELAEAWNNLGIAYASSGQTAQAIEAYRQAVRLNPEDAEAWFALGVAYKLSGQTDQLAEIYRRLQRLDPTLAEKFFTKFVLP